ncbi:hypothetical protein T484DRAFT_1818414 [Baffinella frigidus]|nr:hypothetical protein T484DRAFT_1818414 [Cryptophyta sp. CCMP2293]
MAQRNETEGHATGGEPLADGAERESPHGVRAASEQHPAGPSLSLLDGLDCIKVHRANGALLVTTHDSMPLFFCTEESSWWGRVFLGGHRQREWVLSSGNMGVAAASVVMADGEKLGAVEQTWEGLSRPFMRRLVVSDATPGHAAHGMEKEMERQKIVRKH